MKIFLRMTIVVLGIALVLVIFLNKKLADKNPLPTLGELPPFEFTERNGSSIGLDHLQGKISVVDFIFTHCEGPCPLMSSKMARLYQDFSGNNSIQFISISVDPERDTAERLQEYATRYGAKDSQWLFLRGPLEETKKLCTQGFKLAAEGLPILHSTRFVLVDQNAQIRGYYDSTDPDSLNKLKKHIQLLAKNI